MAGGSNQPGRSVISKISMILLAVSEGGGTLTEITARSELPLSTVHRLATELAAWRVLERSSNGSYRAGPPLRALGQSAQDGGDDVGGLESSFRDRAVPVMDDVFRAIGVRVRVGFLDDAHDVAYVQKDSLHRPVSRECAAARLPAHATALGKALLAFSAAPVVSSALARPLRRFTAFTATCPRQLRSMLRTIRATRLAVSDRELRLDSAAVAAPVLGPKGQVVAAIELEADDLAEDVVAWRPILVVAAGTLSRELALRSPSRPAAGPNQMRGASPPERPMHQSARDWRYHQPVGDVRLRDPFVAEAVAASRRIPWP